MSNPGIWGPPAVIPHSPQFKIGDVPVARIRWNESEFHDSTNSYELVIILAPRPNLCLGRSAKPAV